MGTIVSSILFQPPNPSYTVDSLPNCTLEDIELSSKDIEEKVGRIRIPVVFLPFSGSKRCILYSHGNATNVSQMYPFLQLLNQTLKINVCAYEYVGYCPSAHPNVKPTEARIFQSIECGVNYLKKKGFGVDQIILFGTSLGSGPSIYMASSAKFHGLILQSPFMSVVRTKISGKINLKWMDLVLNYERMPYVKCRTFFIHGTKDDLVPSDHTRQLYSLLPDEYRYEPVFVNGAGHNNVIQTYTIPKYIKALRDFCVVE